MVGRAKWKSEEILLFTKIINQYDHHNHGGISVVSAVTRNLKTAQMVAPNTLPFNSPVRPLQKADRSYRIIADYHNWSVITTVAVSSSMGVSREQINKYFGT